MEIRLFHQQERNEIKMLFTKVFTDSEGASEGVLIGALAADLIAQTNQNDLRGFVAVENTQIIACIFFSRLTFASDINAFLLAPVAVHIDHQGKGIGQKLINDGIEQLKKNGVELVMTYGDPRYYEKVGFKPVSEKVIKSPLDLSMPEGWLGQSLISETLPQLSSRPACVEAINNPAYW